MEEQSEISAAATKEVSDSNSSSYLLIQNKRDGNSSTSSSSKLIQNKRPKLDAVAGHFSSSSSSSKFKGVVVQQNGHWGAQIYANHQRIWLGTFKSEVEAAMAYDSAAIKLRSVDRDSHRNFPWTNITIEEPNFQRQFTTETVLNMIKDGSYSSKFVDYLRAESKAEFKFGGDLVPGTARNTGAFFCKRLFHKELTPSDVGKLNRLVIPKKYAEMYFPGISEESGGVEDTELVFFDRTMRSWKFRYCYWKSSQSYVFTRGWNRFVKEKGLKAKDMIIFSFCECSSSKDGSYHGMQSLYMIDVENTTTDEHVHQQQMESSNGSTKRGFRLFGVQII